jgi:purine nucleosidase/pyrimidine-specific ribonucleoside hydrolase
VWLDCDPGHDDAMALILACHNPAIKLLGVSAVHGNVEVEKCAVNACRVLEIAGHADVPVYMGSAVPLVRKAVTCPEIHGDSGLDGTEFPGCSKTALEGNAVVAMFESIKAHVEANAEKVTLIATGCCTNVALLLRVYPAVEDMLDRIVIMGGSVRGRGNIGLNAEFNILIDPEAADIVMRSRVPTVQVPLDVTHTALVTREVLDRVRGLESKFGKLLEELLLFFAKTYEEVEGMPDPPLHDPCAVAYVINPEMFETVHTWVYVDLHSSIAPGQTLVDWINAKGAKEEEKNCTVALSMDVPRFWDMMLEAYKAADAVSPMNR